jgi:hypothetical protein
MLHKFEIRSDPDVLEFLLVQLIAFIYIYVIDDL